jgi:hypothetical protein
MLQKIIKLLVILCVLSKYEERKTREKVKKCRLFIKFILNNLPQEQTVGFLTETPNSACIPIPQ